MAIAFASVKIHTRSQGHSAVAGAAYRSGSALYDERTGETFDFQNRHDVAYSHIMLPDGADQKYKDREFLWNQVEAAERRKDAQVAKDIVLALPRELSLSQQIDIARNFTYDHFVSKGLVADIAIHSEHSEENPHAHIYITTRRLIGSAFDKHKARDLNPTFASGKNGKGFVAEQDFWGEQWRDFQNQFFKDHQLEIVVDANHIIPQRHEGRIQDGNAHYLKEENRLRRAASIEIALSDPASLLNLLGSQYSVFTDKDIYALLMKNTDSADEFQTALSQLKVYPELIELGRNANGEISYTSKANYLLETNLAEDVNKLFESSPKNLGSRVIEHTIERYQLRSEQANALRYVVDSGQISAIVGRAGTGKSYLMGALRDVYEQQNYRVTGMAFSGIAAKNLKSKSNIASRTIAYYKELIKHDAWHIDQKDIIVMDEAGMVNLHDMADIVRHVKAHGAKLVLVGDPEQLQAIGKGVFRSLLERIGFAELSDIRRQNDIGDRQATAALATGNIAAAIEHYTSKGQVHLLDRPADVYASLINQWQQNLTHASLSERLIMTFQNQHVAELNIAARRAMRQQGLLGEDKLALDTPKGLASFAVGDRILLLRNDNRLGVRNGEFGQIAKIDGKMLQIFIDNEKRPLTIDTTRYSDLTHGYAATIHKSQGTDFKDTYVYVAGSYWDRFLSYVALSRHKDKVQIFADKEQYSSVEKLTKGMSREVVRDTVIDWPLSYALRRGFDPDSLIGRVIEKIGKTAENIKDKWLYVVNPDAYDQKQQWKTKQTERYQAPTTKHEPIAKETTINLLDSKYRKEWENLRKSNIDKIQWAVKLYDLALSKQNVHEQQSTIKTLEKIFSGIVENKRLAPIIARESPSLLQAMKHAVPKNKDRGIDISND